MYVESVKNRNSPPAILVRESYRQDGKVKKRTIANISKLPKDAIETLRSHFRNETQAARTLSESFNVSRSLPHGHVAAVLGSIRNCRVENLFGSGSRKKRNLVIAMIAARILNPRSKLATARGLAEDTATDTLAQCLGLEADLDEDELYNAMDWLEERRRTVERRLAQRHLASGAMAFVDLTSVWMEGRNCPLSRHGHSRDGKRGKLQIEFTLLCDRDGRPVSVEAFAGNTADPGTVSTHIDTLRRRFGLERVVLVGDRGMLTEARIRNEVGPAGFDWISALRAPALRRLVDDGALQPSLFDSTDMAEITCEELYPGERLVVCRNPILAEERARKRESLLQASEQELGAIAAAVQRPVRALRGADRIAVRLDRALSRRKMRKHFILDIREDGFDWRRDEVKIRTEAALDGFYVVRTSVSQQRLGAEGVVAAYKNLGQVERAFRSFKSVSLKVRPVHHRLVHRVRAHLLVCMLAWYVEREMRERLAPLLFADPDGPVRDGIVAPARPSAAARAKASSKTTPEGSTVHSFRTLLGDLATITRNRIAPHIASAAHFDMTTTPTSGQRKMLDLLGVRL